MCKQEKRWELSLFWPKFIESFLNRKVIPLTKCWNLVTLGNPRNIYPICRIWIKTTPGACITKSFLQKAWLWLALLRGAGGWVPGHCYSVPYMKIPANNQVFFIKNVVAVAAYRSCRLWRWVKMSWIHDVLCDHHWTQCRHALSNTGHVAQVRVLEDSRRPPKSRWQDVR